MRRGKYKVTFKQTYQKGTMVKKECLPITKHTNTYQPRRMDILVAGRLTTEDGTEMEFQDVRLYFPVEGS